MSLPIAGNRSTPPSSISRTVVSISSGTRSAGLTHTMPAISGCRVASHTVSVPPIDRPATTTRSHRAARASYAASAAADQSAQPVAIMSSTVVPWPGSSGSSTV
jgi:hypothetical protein